jgi:hypothetical protein
MDIIASVLSLQDKQREKELKEIEEAVVVWSIVAFSVLMIIGITWLSVRDLLKYDQ